jgi:primary-amine oxidase
MIRFSPVMLCCFSREGLVLHQLSYDDGGKQRPVLHRASLVEMAVP